MTSRFWLSLGSFEDGLDGDSISAVSKDPSLHWAVGDEGGGVLGVEGAVLAPPSEDAGEEKVLPQKSMLGIWCQRRGQLRGRLQFNRGITGPMEEAGPPESDASTGLSRCSSTR